jgi:DNA polymerase-4
MRLRQEGFYARSLHLIIKCLVPGVGRDRWEQKVRFLETQDTALFLQELSNLWAQAPKQHIFKIGIVISSLIPAKSHQLSLWEDPKQARLMSALDAINKTHRKNLIVFGASAALEKAPHAPIAFGHIPEEYE